MPFFWFSTANIGVFCSFWWKLCLKPKYTLSISSHHTKFHRNRATGLGFLLHTADASWLFFKCQYRGDPDFQSRSLLKTEQSLPQDLPPHKISGKLVVRQKSFMLKMLKNGRILVILSPKCHKLSKFSFKDTFFYEKCTSIVQFSK